MPQLTDAGAVAQVIRVAATQIDRVLTDPPSSDAWDTPWDRVQAVAGTVGLLNAFVTDPGVAALREELDDPGRWVWDAVMRQVRELGVRVDGMQVSNPAWFDALMAGDHPETPRWYAEHGGSIRAVVTALTERDGSLAALEGVGPLTRTSAADIALRGIAATGRAAMLTPGTTRTAAFGTITTAAGLLADPLIAETIDAAGGPSARPRLTRALYSVTTALQPAGRIGAGAAEAAAYRTSLAALGQLATALAAGGHEGVGA